MKTFKELETLVIQWGEEKGIIGNATPLDQFKKTKEETNELHEALIAQDLGTEKFYNDKGAYVDTEEEIKDAIGDITVTLILQCRLQGLKLEDCLNSAYEVIKNRTGKMVGGQFVKDA